MANLRGMLNAMLPRAASNWKEARYFGRYGEIEMHLLDILCRPYQGAVDVGANCGGYVHFLRHLARHVSAFEPMPEFCRVLTEKFGHYDNVRIYPVALSNKDDRVELYTPLIDGVVVAGGSTLSRQAADCYGQQVPTPVRCVRLDTFHHNSVGFMKIDVEGHESAVLEGAMGTIRTYLPRLLIEIDQHLNPDGLKHICRTLNPLGYHGFYVHGHQLLPVEQFSMALQDPDNRVDMANHSLRDHKRGEYICNFLFLHLTDTDKLVRQIRYRLGK